MGFVLLIVALIKRKQPDYVFNLAQSVAVLVIGFVFILGAASHNTAFAQVLNQDVSYIDSWGETDD